MNVLKLLFLIFIGLQFGCENVCDETVYGTNSDGTTYEECVVYNDWTNCRILQFFPPVNFDDDFYQLVKLVKGITYSVDVSKHIFASMYHITS